MPYVGNDPQVKALSAARRKNMVFDMGALIRTVDPIEPPDMDEAARWMINNPLVDWASL